MDPTQVAAVVAWWEAKLAGKTPTQQIAFISYLVGLSLQTEPPVDVNNVLTTIANSMPIMVFGAFYEATQLDPLPAPTTTTTTTPAS